MGYAEKYDFIMIVIKGGEDMPDLKRIDEKFNEEIISIFDEEVLDRDKVPPITDELFNRMARIEVPFGDLTYFLNLEDGKPVLYVQAWSAMADEIRYWIIDEDSCRLVNADDFLEINEKWFSLAKKIYKNQ